MRIFRPNQVIRRITAIDLSALWDQGIRTLLIDVDNTIACWNDHCLDEDIVQWLQGAQTRGFSIVLISNNRPDRIQPLAQRLGVKMLANARKPHPKAFRHAAGLTQKSPAQCAMIGDQLLTDIVGANRAGIRTILVNPLRHNEFWGTKINRRIERVILTLLRIQREV